MKNKKEKKCKARGCRKKFIPTSSFHVACSLPCSLKIESDKKLKKQKDRKKLDKKKLEELMPISFFHKKAQTAFNAFIRERDKGEPCISCQNKNIKKKNAGHYLSVGARPELRYHPFNCQLQCEKCNSYLSGNIPEYRPNLIAKIGLENVEYLENYHGSNNFTKEDIKEIEKHYKKLLRGIKNGT